MERSTPTRSGNSTGLTCCATSLYQAVMRSLRSQTAWSVAAALASLLCWTPAGIGSETERPPPARETRAVLVAFDSTGQNPSTQERIEHTASGGTIQVTDSEY